MPSSKFQPALFGGLLLGVLSALPLIGVGNLCCCLWILSGGFLAAYLLQASQRTPVTMADGATVGLLAGAIGAVVWFVVSIPVAIVMAPLQQKMVDRLLEGNLPEELRPLLEALRSGGMTAVGLVLSLFMMVLLSVVFSTAGGVIGAVVFKKPPIATPELPPPPPPDLPPSLP